MSIQCIDTPCTIGARPAAPVADGFTAAAGNLALAAADFAAPASGDFATAAAADGFAAGGCSASGFPADAFHFPFPAGGYHGLEVSS